MTRAAELADFSATIERRIGHLPDNSRQVELGRTLVQRMQALGLTDYAQYRLRLDYSAEEWSALAPLLTVPETYFFRLPDQFEALAGAVIPALLRRRPPEHGLRLLSAGCATGQEAYSMRILLNERFSQLTAHPPSGRQSQWPVAIDGFDLNASALERARVGEYSDWSLRATSEQRRREHFERLTPETDKGQAIYRLLPAARAGVTFRQVNLLEEPAADQARYDVIFCRNVLIYFTERAVKEAIERLTQRLVPGGYLFLGPAESLRGLSRDFTLMQTHEVFYYRLREGVATKSAPAANVTLAAKMKILPRAEAAGVDTVRAIERVETVAPESTGETWFESIGKLGSRLDARLGVKRLGVKLPGMQEAEKPEAKRRTRAATDVRSMAGTQRAGQADKPAEAPPDFLQMVAAERFQEALAELDRGGFGDDARLPGDARLLRAAMLVHLGRYEEAAAECTLLLEQGRPDAGAHYLAGLCRDHAGEAAEAEQQMTQATYLDPGFALPLLHRGLLAKRRGDAVTARAALTRAAKALERADEARLTLFAGAVSSAGLRQLCRAELARLDRV